jgi:acyl-CoA hydrolase
MTFADSNSSVVLYDSRTSHAPGSLGRIARFVAVNSAVEVDLAGRVNAEMPGHRHVSGVGGSADFVESGFGSAGGLSVIALTSTTRHGHSRIAPARSSPVVTMPRHASDVLATEWGVVRLAGATLRERAEALITVAHPHHRAPLAQEQNELREQH